ncbi:unnamed protein product [Paramecium octaurelia]|uniref:Uncharacterized protein n=1 Tax=Paramecium octaurelia TaxID=43137 RepID=A0A8S1U430_PAROT|nr:unnamed protein product [Paramecium octaurelia]
MTTEQLSASKKTWAELAEEEDDEIENAQFTTNSETLDKNEIPQQPALTKSTSEFQPKTRNDKQKIHKQRDIDSGGLKNYRQNNSHFNKGNNKQNRQTKSNYDEVYNALFETTNQEILLKVKPLNRNENLEAVKEYFEKQYQNIKAFPRNDINQVDLLTSPKIGLYILDDHRFKTHIGDSALTIHYPQFPNEPLSDYYAKKRYLEKEKKQIQPAPVFQRNAVSSKTNDQYDCNEKSENSSKQDINNFDKVEIDQPQVYKTKDNIEDQQYEQSNLQNKPKYEKRDFNKQTNYKNRKYNNDQEEYEEDYREFKDDKQPNYKSNKYRNEQHQPKEFYQQQKYFQNDNYKYTEKATSDNNKAPYQEKEQHKDYRNNQNYQNYNNANNNYHYNAKRQFKGNNKQKNDQYVIYEEKQKSNYDEVTDNVTTKNSDNFERQAQIPQNLNQPISETNVNEDQNEDIQIDSETEQGQEQVEENKTPNKNKKKKKNKKNLKTSKPNDTNFFGILQSGTK